MALKMKVEYTEDELKLVLMLAMQGMVMPVGNTAHESKALLEKTKHFLDTLPWEHTD